MIGAPVRHPRHEELHRGGVPVLGSQKQRAFSRL